MHKSIRFLSLILVGSVLQATIDQAAAQPPNNSPGPGNLQQSAIAQVSQVLGVPSSFCGHVIDRLMENQMRQNCGVRGYDAGHAILLPGMSVPLKPGDLQLQHVQLLSDSNGAQGPVFLITLQNQSEIPVGDFRITLVAVTGTIQVLSPSVTGNVQRIDAGAVVQFQLQLPACNFDTLVAVIDSFDELLESDELNNVQILSRSNIPVLVTQTTVVTTSEPVVSPSSVPAPGAGGGATIVPDSARTPGDQALPKPSPLDGIDLDQLQPGEADSTTS